MATAGTIDRLRELGGELFLDGERLRYGIPAHNPEARHLLEELRGDRDAVAAMFREQASRPTSLEEVKAALPPGIRLVSYRPKQAPFAVAPISVITDAGKFFRVYLRGLRRRLECPECYAVPPLTDILSKLADAGLDLTTDGVCKTD